MSANIDQDAKNILHNVFMNMLDAVRGEERITESEFNTAQQSFNQQFDNIPDFHNQTRFVERWTNALSELIGLGRR